MLNVFLTDVPLIGISLKPEYKEPLEANWKLEFYQQAFEGFNLLKRPLVLNNFLIKRWSTSKALKRKETAHCRYRSILSLSALLLISYILREISLSVSSQRCLQLPRDCDDKRAPFTYRWCTRARSSGGKIPRKIYSIAPAIFFPIVTVPGNEIRVDDTRARRTNPDSDRLRLKGSLASFAMYRNPWLSLLLP